MLTYDKGQTDAQGLTLFCGPCGVSLVSLFLSLPSSHLPHIFCFEIRSQVRQAGLELTMQLKMTLNS